MSFRSMLGSLDIASSLIQRFFFQKRMVVAPSESQEYCSSATSGDSACAFTEAANFRILFFASSSDAKRMVVKVTNFLKEVHRSSVTSLLPEIGSKVV